MRASACFAVLGGLALSLLLGCNAGDAGADEAIPPNPDPELSHRADFLTNPDCGPGTTFYANASDAERERCRAGIRLRGYTHHYVSVASAARNYYADPNAFLGRLQELVDAGIKPVVWLTSDTGAWRNKPVSEIKRDLTFFIGVIDPLVSSYSLGIEIDEYWTKAEAREIGEHLHTLTTKQVAAHQTEGRWDYCRADWCDYMILQYGFDLPESAITSMTQAAMQDLQKPVVAGEYSVAAEEESIRLGNAGVGAGAAGFGNGGPR